MARNIADGKRDTVISGNDLIAGNLGMNTLISGAGNDVIFTASDLYLQGPGKPNAG